MVFKFGSISSFRYRVSKYRLSFSFCLLLLFYCLLWAIACLILKITHEKIILNIWSICILLHFTRISFLISKVNEKFLVENLILQSYKLWYKSLDLLESTGVTFCVIWMQKFGKILIQSKIRKFEISWKSCLENRNFPKVNRYK